jgi:hypothetical protein
VLKRLALILWLAITPLCGAALDAERDLKIRADDSSAARANAMLVSTATSSIQFSGKTFYFEMPVYLRANGMELRGEGHSLTYRAEDQQSHNDNPLFCAATRFVFTNAKEGTDCITLCGDSQGLDRIAIYGRSWAQSTKPPTGPKPRSCIAVEGHENPPSGRATISGCLLCDADYGILALNTPVETHADLGFVSNTYVSGCRVYFGSFNLQALGWRVEHGFIEQRDTPIKPFEIGRGGKLTIDDFHVNGTHVHFIDNQTDCRPSNDYIRARGVIFDRAGDGGYLKLYTGPPVDIEIDGHANNLNVYKFDRSQLGPFEKEWFSRHCHITHLTDE